MADYEEIVKGSADVNVWMKLDERDGAVVGVASLVYQVFDTDNVSVQAEANGSVKDDDTVTPEIYGSVDTSASGFVKGDFYYVLFTVTYDNGEKPKYRRHIKVT